MKNIFFIFFAFLLCLQACNNKKNSYKTSDAGFEYLYHIQSKSQKFPQNRTMLFLQVRMFNDRDSVLFDDAYFKDFFEKPIPADMPLHHALAMMQEGDSMSFRFNAQDYHRRINPYSVYIDSFAEHEKLRFEVKLEKVCTQDEFTNYFSKQMTEKKSKEEKLAAEKKLKEEKWLSEKKLEEEFLLAEYIERNYPAAEPTASGMYFIQERQGSGALAKPTDKVIIHYTVSYINGEPRYSTYSKNDPLEVRLNDPLLFPCLAEGVQKMRKGGQAIIIAPSKIAAGEGGNADMKIPPYTTLIFNVELIKIGN